MTTVKTSAVSLGVSQRFAASAVSLLVGAFLVFTVGLLPMSVAHNAAHDTRHAIGFPCH